MSHHRPLWVARWALLPRGETTPRWSRSTRKGQRGRARGPALMDAHRGHIEAPRPPRRGRDGTRDLGNVFTRSARTHTPSRPPHPSILTATAQARSACRAAPGATRRERRRSASETQSNTCAPAPRPPRPPFLTPTRKALQFETAARKRKVSTTQHISAASHRRCVHANAPSHLHPTPNPSCIRTRETPCPFSGSSRYSTVTSTGPWLSGQTCSGKTRSR